MTFYECKNIEEFRFCCKILSKKTGHHYQKDDEPVFNNVEKIYVYVYKKINWSRFATMDSVISIKKLYRKYKINRIVND